MSAFSGVYVAALTPRREGPEIDLASAFELIDFLCRAGVDGIALMGSTGEFPHFSIEERSRLVSLAVKRSRVPVLAGVSHSTFDGALSLAREAADAGAAGVLLMPPYFFPYGRRVVRQFFLEFAERFKGAAPIVLYDIPEFSSPIGLETAVELLETGAFAGIKDSSGQWEEFAGLRAARDKHPFSLLVGQDALFARARAEGADGIISGVASVLPELLVALDRALTGGQAARTQALDARLQEFLRWLREFPAPVAIRETAIQRGLHVGPHASPPGPEDRQGLTEFSAWFAEWWPVVQKECADA